MTDTPGTGLMRGLFLCTHNSSRSQMAEGPLLVRGGMDYQAFSAGTHPRAIHPLAAKAMAELDIDISERAGHRAKGIEEDVFLARENDVTPYDQAHNASILLGLCKANRIKSAI